MNADVVELETSIHQKVQKLLPWAPERLRADERAFVERHLATCPQCQQDLDWQRRLQSIGPAPGAMPDMERALAKLLPRLETRASGPRRAMSQMAARLFDGAPGWTRWALAAQLVAIVGLSGALLRPGDSYRLLGAQAAPANLVVMFQPAASEQQLRAILEQNGARVVDGPTVTNAWLLSVAPARRDAALAALRAHAQVQMAEPLTAERAP
ncbi:MAG: zf-HC2 domain-containing protein [Pseudomonadota bacterium]